MVNADIKSLVLKAAEILKISCKQPVREARIILSYVLRCTLAEIIAETVSVSPEIEKRFFELVKIRADGCPFAYITGEKEFFGLNFRLCRDTLIPRGDTETLVSFVLENAQISTLLDLCCGSGCIAVASAVNLKNITVSGVDISPEAVEFSEKNAKANGVGDRCKFYVCDILNEIPGGRYDIIVSNPPYIKTADIEQLEKTVKNFEPMRALDGGGDGLAFYRRICEIAPAMLKDGGILAFEIGFDQYDEVASIMGKNFKDIGFRCDLSDIKRVVFGTKI